MAASGESKTLPSQPKEPSQDNVAATTTNSRGIPSFPFMSNVTDYVKSTSETEGVLTRFQEMISKYQFMQSNVERRAAGLREKLPEMKRTLDVVKFLRQQKAKLTGEPSGTASEDDDDHDDDDDEGDDLDDLKSHDGDDDDNDNNPQSQKKKKSIQTTFPLQDTLYAHAQIDPTTLKEVYLWLGANVMVAYPLDEAEELLRGKLEKAKESLKFAEEDLEFLRIQVTTLEVATARVHNWDVGEKRKLKEIQQKGGGGGTTIKKVDPSTTGTKRVVNDEDDDDDDQDEDE